MHLDRLTIVIPTYTRQPYLQRAIEYWSSTPVQVVIVDGSPEPIAIGEEVPSSGRVTYHHAPGTTLEERLGRSTEFVTTEYAALISDDEFFLPSALTNCIQFLDRHPDFASCKGLSVGIGWDGRRVTWKPMNRTLRGYSVEAGVPSERMYEHLSSYAHASLWSVQRSSVFAASMLAVASAPGLSSAPCFELQVALVNSYRGKIKVLDELMWLRSYENKSIAWAQAPMSIREWWRDISLEHERTRLMDSVMEYAAVEEDSGPTFEQIESAIEAHVQGAESRYLKGLQQPKSTLAFRLNLALRGFVKQVLNNTVFVTNGYPGYSLISHVKKEYPGKSDEVAEVAKRVAEFHASRGYSALSGRTFQR